MAGGTAQGIRAGKAYVELFADDSKLVRGLKSAQKRIAAFGQSLQDTGLKLAGLGAAVLAPLGAAVKTYTDMGDALAKASDRTGVSVEGLSELGYAASQSGADMATLETGLKKMQKLLFEAATGSATAQETLARLGLTVGELSSLSPEKQFLVLADRLSAIDDPATKAALAMEVLGRQGVALLPLMKDGAAGIELLREEARRLGLTISTQDARAAEVFGDAISRMWATVKAAAFAIGAALAPAIQSVSQWLTRALAGLRQWIDQHRGFVVLLAQIALAVTAVGGTLMGAGLLLRGFAFSLGGLAKLLPLVGFALKIVGVALGAILSPIGLVITGVAALAVAFFKFTAIGQQALAWLGEKFQGLMAGVTETISGIGDALAAGDISLAAKILWLSLKLAWQNGVQALRELWLEFSGWFVQAGQTAFYGLLSGAEYLWHGLKIAWIEGTAFLKKLWANFAAFHADTTEWLTDKFTRAWIGAQELVGAMSKDEADFARDYAGKQHRLASDRIQDELTGKLGAAEQERKAKRQTEADAHNNTLAAIGTEYDAKLQAMREAHAQRLAAGEQELDAARKEWREAINAAKEKRRLNDAATQGPAKDRTDYEALVERLGSAGSLLSKGPGVLGTFNPFEAARMPGQSLPVQERIATAAEKTARNTGNLLRAVQNNVLVFI